MDEIKKPLTGIRVLDIACFIAAPHAASIMGEFGADVIKVEHPNGGDPWRRYGTQHASLFQEFLAVCRACLSRCYIWYHDNRVSGSLSASGRFQICEGHQS